MKIKWWLVIVIALAINEIFFYCNNKDVTEAKTVFLDEDDIGKSKAKSFRYLSLEDDPYADDASRIQSSLLKWNFISKEGKKTAYLTFDDGPSNKVTGEVLDVLKENDVKATFFVVGYMIDTSEQAKENLIRMVEEGHAVGNHGYSHKYDKLYSGSTVRVDAFIADINKSLDTMRLVLGDEFNTRVIRFPGGHNTWRTSEIDKYLNQNNYIFIDWNVLNGDGFAYALSKGELLSNLKRNLNKINKNNDTIVILMHDTDKNVNEAAYLQEAIIYLKSLGYEFRTLK